MASRLAGIALANVAREYPGKPDHALASDDDLRPPRELHPSFHGSYDWHSCVHMHWLLAHLLRLFPALPQRAAIESVFDRHLAAGLDSADYLGSHWLASFAALAFGPDAPA